VKAEFLFRFASYVEWPADAAGGSFVIAVVGAEKVARQLDELVPRTKVRGGVVEVRRIRRASDLEGVNILFVGRDALARTRSLRAAALERPILLVTDDGDGFSAGAIINFIELDHNVRFEISLVAADRAGLKIDSALLSVASRVELRPQASLPHLAPNLQVEQINTQEFQISPASLSTFNNMYYAQVNHGPRSLDHRREAALCRKASVAWEPRTSWNSPSTAPIY